MIMYKRILFISVFSAFLMGCPTEDPTEKNEQRKEVYHGKWYIKNADSSGEIPIAVDFVRLDINQGSHFQVNTKEASESRYTPLIDGQYTVRGNTVTFTPKRLYISAALLTALKLSSLTALIGNKWLSKTELNNYILLLIPSPDPEIKEAFNKFFSERSVEYSVSSEVLTLTGSITGGSDGDNLFTGDFHSTEAAAVVSP